MIVLCSLCFYEFVGWMQLKFEKSLVEFNEVTENKIVAIEEVLLCVWYKTTANTDQI